MAKKDNADTPKTGIDRWNATETKGGASKRKKRSGRSSSKSSKRAKRRMPATSRKYVTTLALLAVLCVVCVIGFTPLSERITTGLDIQGGVSVILTATKSDGSAPTADEMSTAQSIVEKRVNTLGASEATVQIQGSNSILVQIPGATDAESAVETIGQTGHLEFVRMDDIGDAEALAKIQAGTENVELEDGTYTAFLDGSYIESTSVSQSSSSVGTYSVNITFNSEGAEIFDEVTKELAPSNGQICIVLDGVVQSAPAVQEEISGGQVSITGDFTLEEAQSLKTVLDSGSLPVTLTYSESRVVGPTLGQDSLRQGVLALVVGVAIVIVYLFFFYRGLGFLTLGSLGVFAILYLGLLALLSSQGLFSLSLPGLAGMVLTTGSAADSSILVLERFREEIRMGKTVKNASVTGASHGIRTSLDADIVTLVTALALFFVGAGTVKGFGLTLALGVVCDIVTMFCFKAPALRLLAVNVIPAHPKFWGINQDLDEAARRAEQAAANRGARSVKPVGSKKGGEARA
ncbi:MAG: protein translocase subunit SecD [Tractidigestivibacter sp.]|jgi:preprotein translocase subunit SecD|uniref:protein translocase subunit SecD n=1 Tax=Tractidigestivibacter sp. TaxID=2847320 RepID=UPI003D8DD451